MRSDSMYVENLKLSRFAVFSVCVDHLSRTICMSMIIWRLEIGVLLKDAAFSH
jgi:hypothetical protein